MGRMQYAPTRCIEKRKMNNEKIRYLANLAGIPDALIFFSHPFLVSRQEKDGFPRKKRRTNNKKAGYAQEESSYAPGIFYVPFWGDTLSRYRMLAIEIISANTPAAVTSAPAP